MDPISTAAKVMAANHLRAKCVGDDSFAYDKPSFPGYRRKTQPSRCTPNGLAGNPVAIAPETIGALRPAGLRSGSRFLVAIVFLVAGTIFPLSHCYIARFDATNPALTASYYAVLSALLDTCANPDKIAYTSNADGDHEIYIMNDDGSDVTRVTNNTASDTAISWSRDSSRFVFQSDRSGTQGLYLIDSDGSNERELLVDGFNNLEPVFSPDSTGVYFVSNKTATSNSIYYIDIETGVLTRITAPPIGTNDRYPAISFDGQRIAFESTRDGGQQQIYLMNSDGTNQIGLNNGNTLVTNLTPRWACE